jgi:hypothetical protein
VGLLFWNGSVGFASEEALRKSTNNIEVPIRPRMARELVSLVDFSGCKSSLAPPQKPPAATKNVSNEK